MKKNKIIVLLLSLTLMLTFTACTTKGPKVGRNNTKLSTQTRDSRWDNNMSGTDRVRDNNRNNIYMNENIDNNEGMNGVGDMDNPLDSGFNMDINNSQRDGLDTNINNGKLEDGLDTNIYNGMSRPKDNVNNNMNDQTEVNEKSKNLAKKITDLSEVNKASVLLSGKDAVIGVNLRGNTQSTMTNSLRKKIEDMVKKEDKSIDNISITTDPSLVNRINTMHTDVNGGNVINDFADEVKDLIRKITPNNIK